MSARHDDPLREYLTRADFLLKHLQSPDPETARGAEQRFAAAGRSDPSSARRKDALDVIAVESGAPDWRTLRSRVGEAAPGLTSIGDLLTRWRPDVGPLLDGRLLPDRGVTVLAGPSSHGKSGLALQIARATAARADRPVLFFSTEMPRTDVLARLLATEAGVDLHEIRRDGAAAIPGASERLAQAGSRIESLPLYVSGEVDTLTGVAGTCGDVAENDGPLGLIVLDYISLFSIAKFPARRERPAEVAIAVSELAARFGCPVLVVAGLERRSAAEENPRPGLEELGRWSVLADAAACAVLIHRPNVHLGWAQNEAGPIHLDVCKHPQGTWRCEATIVPSLRLVRPEPFAADG